MCVTHPEAREYILQIVGDAVQNKTITYLQLRPYLDLKAIAKKNPNTDEMHYLRFLFFSFEGRFANFMKKTAKFLNAKLIFMFFGSRY